MNLIDADNERLTGLVDELSMLSYTIDYEGYDPDRISNEKAISILANKMVELIEIIQRNSSVEHDLTKEDYEAIYGWGGQG
jgi:hypothetical protein